MDFQELYDSACDVAWAAGHNVDPTPVTWQDEQTGKVYEPCTEGLCGFAWINVKPGNSAFARWLLAEGLARKDSYYGGVTIWVRDFNQSYERKLAYANAFAQCLKVAGIKAMAASRLD